MKPSVPNLLLVAALAAAALSSCTVGPAYHPPAVETPATYKSAATQPAIAPAHLANDWYRLFGDEELTSLEQSALRENQNLKAAMARVTEARQATRAVASQFYPIVTLNPSAVRARSSANAVRDGTAHTANSISIPFDVSYEVDIWGRVRRSVESAQATEQASVDDAAVVLLTLTADLAQNYFTLRALDAQTDVTDRNIALYQKQLSLTQQELKAGTVTRADVLQAQALLDATTTQRTDLQRQRAATEHAIAILLGRPPAAVSIAARPYPMIPPQVPPGLPSEMLRHRPDVAEAEQNLIAANAAVGVATANFYPVVHLTGAAGYESFDLAHTLDWESRIWSLGPSVTVPVFEGGQLDASLQQAKARYDELMATYRGTVLVAFQDVEDALANLHHYSDEAESQQRAVQADREYLSGFVQVQYEKGLISYFQVISADRTLLTDEILSVQIAQQRMISTVLLIKALGGGWNPDQPPPAATQP